MDWLLLWMVYYGLIRFLLIWSNSIATGQAFGDGQNIPSMYGENGGSMSIWPIFGTIYLDGS